MLSLVIALVIDRFFLVGCGIALTAKRERVWVCARKFCLLVDKFEGGVCVESCIFPFTIYSKCEASLTILYDFRVCLI
jgi:hypothetical protein